MENQLLKAKQAGTCVQDFVLIRCKVPTRLIEHLGWIPFQKTFFPSTKLIVSSEIENQFREKTIKLKIPLKKAVQTKQSQIIFCVTV